MGKKMWIAFAITQGTGLLCFWTCERLRSADMWATSFVLLLPGNAIGGAVIEKLLWTKVSLRQMALLHIPLELMINAAVWMTCAWTMRVIRRSFAGK